MAFVARGGTAKLANLRARRRASLVFRAGWEWVAVHGSVELAGPDDPLPGVTTDTASSPADGGERLRVLLRDVYAAAGGSHPDLAAYDRVMAVERRTVVLLTPDRFAHEPAGGRARRAPARPRAARPTPAPPKRRSTDDHSGRDRHRPPAETTTAVQPPPVAPGTIQLWTDLLCPFAHVAVHRLRETRERLGLGGHVRLDHHVFPLELFNGPHPRRGTDTEAVGLGQVAPEAGFRVWTAADDLYPHTVLLAAEAVLAASRSRWMPRRPSTPRCAGPSGRSRARSPTARSSSTSPPRSPTGTTANAVLDVDQLADALDSGRYRGAPSWRTSRSPEPTPSRAAPRCGCPTAARSTTRA